MSKKLDALNAKVKKQEKLVAKTTKIATKADDARAKAVAKLNVLQEKIASSS